ncbi:stage III sporulation protein AF [Thalassobacillus hwangdonensis]|uniref:Stage III sporulation protein AF n=1 Tax=Thalassobacillus hwangdonensis TaxID=546108 RepID=A0ABW3KYU3_9BACI
MSYIVQWVTEIVIFLLLAMVIDFLLPSGSMQKYARLTVSLILVLIFLNPLFELFNTDVDQLIERQTAAFSQQTLASEEMEKSIELKKNEIQASQDAYILEQMVVQMKVQAETSLVETFQTTISDLKLSFGETPHTPENLNEVIVTLTPENQVESVNDVEIDITKEAEGDEDTPESSEIIQHLAEVWQVPEEMIKVEWEGEHG